MSTYETWANLSRAALAHATNPDDLALKGALQSAAVEHAKALWTERTGHNGTKASTGRGARSGVTIPFGRSKGVPIEEADTKDLKWVSGRIAESIADPSKSRWLADNQRLLGAIDKELSTR